MSFLKSVAYFAKKLIWFFSELILSVLYYKNIKVFLCNHFTIGIKYLRKKRTRFPHPVGIVIGKNVQLGSNCIIYQNVTIGTKQTNDDINAEYPKIGNNVIIYPNSVLFGDIEIGDNAIIGAGSIIFFDIPPNAVVAGNPAKIIKIKEQANDIGP